MNFENALREKDRLTGIFSRDYFDQTAREILDYNQEVDFAIMEIDVNRLNVINELYGVSEGDNVLKYMGTTLENVFSGVPFALYARIQADLFVVLCPYDERRIEEYINEIEEDFEKYSRMLNIDILLSFGIYECTDRDAEIQILRDRAKMALKSVKGNYVVHTAYYNESMHEKMANEQMVVMNMSSALKNREFVTYFQPKHSLDDGRVVGAEALVRWNSPEKGMISPGVFIPIFEENGFITKLDRYVWEDTCRFIKEQLDAGRKLEPISVNVSRINLYKPEFVKTLKDLVDKYDIPTRLLELEFTESAYVDNPQLMLQIMNELQDYGFKVEMDDFGSGYSSLNMLKDVDVDVLKIDMKFLSKTDNADKAVTIMSSIIRMAKWLGIPSIVEGVETQEQIDYLKSIGCTMVQGYYFSRPLPEKDFLEYIDAHQIHEIVAEVEEKLINQDKLIHPDEIWKKISATRTEQVPLFAAYGLYENRGEFDEAIRLSDSFFEVFKVSRESFFSGERNERDYVLAEDRNIVGEAFENASKDKNGSIAIFRRRAVDGSIQTVYAKIHFLGLDFTGYSKLYYVGMNDITEQVKYIK